MKPANIFKRILAFIIDFIVICCFAVPVVLVFLFSNPDLLVLQHSTVADNIAKLICIFFAMAYFSLFESSKTQATLGKRLLNLYVTDTNNKRLNLSRAFLRYILFGPIGYILHPIDQYIGDTFGYYCLLSILIGLIINLPIFFTKERKTLYDILSSTRVYAKPNATDQLKKELAEQGKLINELKACLKTQ